jgi:hypothetical protein
LSWWPRRWHELLAEPRESSWRDEKPRQACRRVDRKPSSLLIIVKYMGRLTWFFAGSFLGGVQILNQVYETELLKEQVARDLATSQRMKNFVIVHSFMFVVGGATFDI